MKDLRRREATYLAALGHLESSNLPADSSINIPTSSSSNIETASSLQPPATVSFTANSNTTADMLKAFATPKQRPTADEFTNTLISEHRFTPAQVKTLTCEEKEELEEAMYTIEESENEMAIIALLAKDHTAQQAMVKQHGLAIKSQDRRIEDQHKDIEQQGKLLDQCETGLKFVRDKFEGAQSAKKAGRTALKAARVRTRTAGPKLGGNDNNGDELSQLKQVHRSATQASPIVRTKVPPVQTVDSPESLTAGAEAPTPRVSQPIKLFVNTKPAPTTKPTPATKSMQSFNPVAKQTPALATSAEPQTASAPEPSTQGPHLITDENMIRYCQEALNAITHARAAGMDLFVDESIVNSLKWFAQNAGRSNGCYENLTHIANVVVGFLLAKLASAEKDTSTASHFEYLNAARALALDFFNALLVVYPGKFADATSLFAKFHLGCQNLKSLTDEVVALEVQVNLVLKLATVRSPTQLQGLRESYQGLIGKYNGMPRGLQHRIVEAISCLTPYVCPEQGEILTIYQNIIKNILDAKTPNEIHYWRGHAEVVVHHNVPELAVWYAKIRFLAEARLGGL